MNEHLKLLGLRVRDKITKMEGVVTCVSFDLYGCIQALVHPGLDKDGKPREVFWYDVSRLKILSTAPVIDVPDFGDDGRISRGMKGAAGPSEKPVR